MKHFLVDTNVVIDLLLNRDGADAAALFDGAEKSEYRISICSLSFTNIYYSLRKFLSHNQRINCLMQLQEVLHILPVDENVIKASLACDWQDFEDAVQYYSAAADGSVNGIVTRNTKDFKKSKIEVIDPKFFLG